ncbi:3-dehydroquinate synthase [Jejudonia soesokkakensis]|uniref:3-dehydroquinate synthase n=1 Tax=Jejudonia soesokkakensis TaxID=1323432 RepID=A0ABW2MV91_9FLAO
MMEIKKERGAVYCNEEAWKHLKSKLVSLHPSKLFILVNTHTARFCLPVFLELSEITSYEVLTIEAGEKYKNITSCVDLWHLLSEKGADRKSVLINLGGGVVTDLGGFVASTFKRGIEFINIPTSLLAMVDASVGGKNGVDLGTLKNQIGVIKEPLQVIVDTNFLKTLPKNEVVSGYAEMLKHGLIHSEDYWNDVQKFDIKNPASEENLIWKSILIKNEVVTEDPFEQNRRKTLNYGHTLGHAIESYCLASETKKTLLHGEAIAIGIILATFLSTELLNFPKQKCQHIANVILSHYPKVEFTETTINDCIELLKYDKKNQHGKVLFVLLNDIGKHEINCEVPNDLIYKAFSYYKNL